MSTAFDRRYIARHARGLIRASVIVIVLGVLAGVLGSVTVSGLVKELGATHTTTSGEVVDVDITRTIVGARRPAAHVEERRIVTIDYTLDGRVISGTARSDDLQVGDSVTVWVEPGSDEVALAEPGDPGFWSWTGAIVVPLIAIGLLWFGVWAMRGGLRVSAFRPDGRQPDSVFVVQGLGVTSRGRRGRKRTLVFSGVIETDSVDARVGGRARLLVDDTDLPQAQTYPDRIAGYYLTPGAETTSVVLHTPELNAWWAAGLVRM